MDNFYRDIKISLIVVVVICIATMIIDFAYGSSANNLRFFWVHVAYSLYYGTPLTLVNGWFFTRLNKRYPWDKVPRQRAIYGIVGLIILSMAVLLPLNFLVWVFIHGKAADWSWIAGNRIFFTSALIISAVATITLHAFGFYREVQKERLVSAQLRQEKLLTELSVLRAQVDPHFLFNSFNVLSGLIEEDREKAQDFLAGLSRIYRYVLEQRNDTTTTLADELAFAQEYLRLQQMRFEDSIELCTDIDPVLLERKIPSLSLQLLLENAIKHNGFDPSAPLVISIKNEEDQLVVRNNRKERKNLSSGNGIGLQNIRERYALLKHPSPTVEQDGHTFTVKLPLI